MKPKSAVYVNTGESAKTSFVFCAAASFLAFSIFISVYYLGRSMWPSAHWSVERAAARVDLTSLEPGVPRLVVNRRNEAILVLRLTEEQQTQALSFDIASLRDRLARNANLHTGALATYENRTLPTYSDVVVLNASCDSFTAVPLFDAGDYGGWFCVRYATHFDILGRVHKGGTGINLKIPRYRVLPDDTLVIVDWNERLNEAQLDRILYGSQTSP